MSIESLLIKQARLSDLRRRLKAEGSEEADRCERYAKDVKRLGYVDSKNCIGWVFDCFKDDVYEANCNHCEGPEFEEIWEIAVDEGEVCQHCQNVRNLKKQRMQAGRELAGVRAAITRVGRRLAKEQVA